MQTISSKVLKNIMYSRDIPVFIYKIHYPVFTTTCNTAASQRINAYYFAAAKRAEYYCRTILYPKAVESTRYIQNNQPPFSSYEFIVNYQITYNRECITSLYLEQYTYMGGAHGTTFRKSNTWDFATGCQIKLENFYPSDTTFPEAILKSISGQIRERQKETPSSYFDNYAVLLRDSFQLDQYYLKPNSLVIYYQQYDIAPYASGIPEFFLPLIR